MMNIINAVDLGVSAMDDMQEALNGSFDAAGIESAKEKIDQASIAMMDLCTAVQKVEAPMEENIADQSRFNHEIERGTNQADALVGSIKSAVAAYATIQTLTNTMDLSDQLTSTTARLNMMNEQLDAGAYTAKELQDMIFLSAERSRGAYQTTADAVSKLGLMAGDAFSGSEEIIAFMEQVNKQFVIAGTEASGIDAAMLQLTQAMGSGVLRGEEYNSILEQAPNIIQNIASYIEGNEAVLESVANAMGMKTEELAGNVKGNLKDIAGEGLLSAELVKSAMFAAADETNARFESMPKTFEQIWTSFQNHALMAFQPVLERMNEIGNSEAFQEFVNGTIEALAVAAGATLEIFDLLAAGGGFVTENWSLLSPIIYGVAGALMLYYGMMLLCNTVTGVGTAIATAKAAAENVHAASMAMSAGATFAATVAQYGFNAALLACPITWIVIGVIAFVAAIYVAVAAVNKFAGTSISATGIICGVFTVAAAFIGNVLITLLNFIIDAFALLWNFIAAFANFFGNVFNNPVAAIIRLISSMADIVLGILEAIASAIDTLFGSNLAGAVSGWRSSLGGLVDETFGRGEEIMEKADASSFHLERFEYKDAWNAGYSFGKGIDESIANFNPSSLFENNIPNPDDYRDLSNYGAGMGELDGIGGGVNDIAGNTGKMADAMEITGEELKYLRDIAEQEAINRFTTAEINIQQTNHNTINNGMDLDGVVSGLDDALGEAIEIATEGVHE
jgi:tape measure domain-containing protein